MTTSTFKVKNGVIRLPRELETTWEEADVYISGSRDIITVKRLSNPSISLGAMMDEFQKTAQRAKLTPKDVHNEIQAFRKRKR